MAEFKKLINPPIKASEINSESATNGQVLTANGTGGATWQDASGGTEVVANPTLSGTESDLTGLEVAGTKYKVPSGGSGGGTQLYNHVVNNDYSFITSRELAYESISDIYNDNGIIRVGRFSGSTHSIYIVDINNVNIFLWSWNPLEGAMTDHTISAITSDTVTPL